MATAVDSVILELEAKLGNYKSEVEGAANATERALTRVQSAASDTEKAVGRNRMGMQQLSYQLGDMATMFALGARPMQIFASQSGQIVQAVQLMTGGTSKLASFLGGPWGIAVLAAAQVLTPLIGKLFDTKDALDGVGDAALDAMAKLREAMRQTSDVQGAIDTNQQKLINGLAAVGKANAEITRVQGLMAAAARTPGGVNAVEGLNRRLQQLEGQRAAGQRDIEAAQRGLDEVRSLSRAENLRARNEDRLNDKPDKPRKPRAERKPKGPSAEQIEDRYLNQLDGYRAEIASAMQVQAANAQEEAELAARGVENARRQALRNIDADKNYSDAQKARLREAYEQVAAANLAAIEFRKQQRIEQETQQLADERHQAEADGLRNQYELASTEAERRDIALRILDVEDAYLRSKLEAIKASETATDAERQRAAIALDALDRTANDRRDLVALQHQGPLARYADSLADPRTRVEAAVARKLEAVNQGITDALTESLGIKDDFVKDLFSIFLDEVIFRPLAESLSSRNAGGGGGLGGLLGTVFSAILGFGGGRATGGPVSPGQAYAVNERSTAPGLFLPIRAGSIISNDQAAGPAGRTSGGSVRLVIEEAPGFAARVRTEALGVAVEVHRATRPGVVAEAASGTMRAASRKRLP